MNMKWIPYRGESYLDYPATIEWCQSLAKAYPDWVKLEEIGMSRHGRPILFITIGNMKGDYLSRPAFWTDGGTHASEWTGVMTVLYSVSKWIEGLSHNDKSLCEWFHRHTVFALPCISPDGFQALQQGEPFMRSTLRPPKEEEVRRGFEPCDVDDDNVVRWMRWKHPSGSFVIDEENPSLMRPRRLDDPTEKAYFFCQEGKFLQWDGISWTSASLKYGCDLNRNFPVFWKPYNMIGLDGGDYPLSEFESRLVFDTFVSRAYIAAAVTNHTYTGCILTAPHRPETPLPDSDILMMEALAKEAVVGTGYRVFRFYPDFVYDPKNLITGALDETITCLFGIPAYSTELWDPYGFCGIHQTNPAREFIVPNFENILQMMRKFSSLPNTMTAWKPFDHPQLGNVEIGGIDYLRTIRNPPVNFLAAECQKGFQICDRIRKTLPDVYIKTKLIKFSENIMKLECIFENYGYLATNLLQHAETLRYPPKSSVKMSVSDNIKIVEGMLEQSVPSLDGWGMLSSIFKRHPTYAMLPQKSNATKITWLLQGNGSITIQWKMGRAGKGIEKINI